MAKIGHMNDTKWDEVRVAMYNFEPSSPKWRTKDAISGYVSDWDGEWFYHFRPGGYATIEWVEIAAIDSDHRARIRALLHGIHVPGEETPLGFRVFGYTDAGERVEYL